MSTRMNRPGVRSWGVGALLVAGVALTGCTAAGSQAIAPSGQASTEASASASDVNGLPAGVVQATEVPSDVPNVPELRANVTVDDCSAADGGWRASGTAKNPGESETDYTITVFFTTDQGTVIGTGATTASLPAGGSGDWTITAELTPAPETRCVLRGVG